MKKYTLSQPLREILYLQGLGANKQAYKYAMPGYLGGHPGVDVNFGDGDPVLSYFNATVVYIQEDSVVTLTDPDKDGNCIEWLYGHMQDQAVKVGDKVTVGQLLGNQGSVGPTITWINGQKEAWSHLHKGYRIARLGRMQQTLRWDFPAYSSIPYHIVEYDAAIDHFRDPNERCHQVVYRVAKAFQVKEGWYPGSRSYRNKNPGNIRNLDGTFKVFSIYDDPDSYNPNVEGLDALEDYLLRVASGKHKAYLKWGAGMTIYQMCQTYAPKSDGNDPMGDALKIVKSCGFRSINDPCSDWLLTELEWAKKYNNAELIVYPPEIPLVEIDPKLQEIERERDSLIVQWAQIFKQWWSRDKQDK